jgi:hypothetical protein
MSESSVLHQLCKLFKEVTTVVWSWPGLRVILHAECRRIENSHTFVGLIIEVQMCHGHSPTQTFGVNTEVVILTGDFDMARSQMLHWMISAMMSERQFVRCATKGAT